VGQEVKDQRPNYEFVLERSGPSEVPGSNHMADVEHRGPIGADLGDRGAKVGVGARCRPNERVSDGW